MALATTRDRDLGASVHFLQVSKSIRSASEVIQELKESPSWGQSPQWLEKNKPISTSNLEEQIL